MEEMAVFAISHIEHLNAKTGVMFRKLVQVAALERSKSREE